MLDFVFTDTLTARLEAAAKAATDFTPAMAAIADYMRSAVVLNFESESGPDGTAWQKSQRAIDDGGLTLTDTGHLRQSITAANDATTAIAGTNLVYAAIHQLGGSVRRRQSSRHQNVPKPNIFPARPFLGFGPDDIGAIESIIAGHLDRAFSGVAA